MSVPFPSNQFHIPEGLAEQTPAVFAEVPANQESAPTPLETLKHTEAHIFALREAALRQPVAQEKGWLNAAKFLRPQQPPTQQELIDKESYCGGKIVHVNGNDRFWLDVQTEATKQSGVADWYFVKPVENSPSKHQVIRFQTTDTKIHKLFEGKVVPLSDDEISAFLETTAVYKSVVTALYESVQYT